MDVYVTKAEKIAKSLDVFYNPRMELNRTITVEVLKAFGKKGMQIALPLAASGIRGIRLLKELPASMIKRIDFNDHSNKAVALIKKNLKLNNIASRHTLSEKQADQFLLEGKGWDYIDIDPFGSPNFLLDAAMKRIARDGLLGVTATDTAALAGTYPNTCKRKYDALSIRNHMKHEIAARILIRKVQLIGAQYERACIPIVSYAKEHYVRIFFRCMKSKTKAENIVRQHGLLGFCKKHGIVTQACCSTEMAGSLWMGSLFDKSIKRMNKELPFVQQMQHELGTLGFYDIHHLSTKNIPKTKIILERLHKKRYKATTTLFYLYGLKTNAPYSEVKKALR